MCLQYTLRAASRGAIRSRSGAHSLLCPETKSRFSSPVSLLTLTDTHAPAIALPFSQKSLHFLLALTSYKGLGKEWDTEIRNQTQRRHHQLQKYTTRNAYPKVTPSHKVADDLGEQTSGYIFPLITHTWVLSKGYVQFCNLRGFVSFFFFSIAQQWQAIFAVIY